MLSTPFPYLPYSTIVMSPDGEFIAQHTAVLDHEIHVHVGKDGHRRRVLELLEELGYSEIVAKLRVETASRRKDNATWQRELRELASDAIDRRRELPWEALGIEVKRFARLV